jgi:DNA-binding winged helix-turn-helix (wHTH) protein
VTTFGPFTLDDAARQLSRRGEPVHLSPKAFDVLALLVSRRPDAISKSELLDALWPGTFVSEGNLAVIVAELRDALGDNARQPTFIRTVQRFGYAFAGAASGATRLPAAAMCWVTWGTQRVPLLDGEHLIGRDPAAAVFVDMAGVSRRHATIAVNGEEITLMDLGSKNGTFYRGQKITSTVVLANDESIVVGLVPLRFRFSEAAPSTRTVAKR